MTRCKRLRRSPPSSALLALAVGLHHRQTVLASYLVAWTAACAIRVGALAVFFTAYLVRAGWTHHPRGLC